MESDVRQRLALALDVDDLVAALRLAQRVRPWFAVVKVGLELFAAAGPDAVLALSAEGYRVFLDLKLHDIPTTVGRAARVIGGLGAQYTTVHSAGGDAMMRAAVEGMAAGAAAAGMTAPCVLGATVLTSDADATPQILRARAAAAAAAGCGGLVCAAADLSVTRQAAPGLITVVPGIRPAGVGSDDQARAAEPGTAIAAGADILVIGRAVTAAEDPEAAAAAVAGEVAASIAGGRG
jgi:orotidine-5'-phosphate decarboxylase